MLFRGRPGVPEEVDVLRDLIPEAKRSFRGAADNAFFRRSTDKSTLTADTPVPYRIADLLALIDERIGRLDGRNEKPYLRQLKARVSSAINDPRYHFMFSSNTINDTLAETIGRLFRIPADGQPITTFQLSGIPSEVVNSVASVLCRMAFEVALWSNGGVRILVVCEEAHRYVPADPNLGFIPDPAGDRPHRQGGAQIRRQPRRHHPAAGRTRPDDPVAVLDGLRHAARQRPRPGDHPLGHPRFLGLDHQLPVLDRQWRGDRLRRGGRGADAHALFQAAEAPVAEGQSRSCARPTADADKVDLRAVVQGMRALSSQETAASAAGPAPAPQPGDDPYEPPCSATGFRPGRPQTGTQPARRQAARSRRPAPAAGARTPYRAADRREAAESATMARTDAERRAASRSPGRSARRPAPSMLLRKSLRERS